MFVLSTAQSGEEWWLEHATTTYRDIEVGVLQDMLQAAEARVDIYKRLLDQTEDDVINLL